MCLVVGGSWRRWCESYLTGSMRELPNDSMQPTLKISTDVDCVVAAGSAAFDFAGGTPACTVSSAQQIEKIAVLVNW